MPLACEEPITDFKEQLRYWMMVARQRSTSSNGHVLTMNASGSRCGSLACSNRHLAGDQVRCMFCQHSGTAVTAWPS